MEGASTEGSDKWVGRVDDKPLSFGEWLIQLVRKPKIAGNGREKAGQVEGSSGNTYAL